MTSPADPTRLVNLSSLQPAQHRVDLQLTCKYAKYASRGWKAIICMSDLTFILLLSYMGTRSTYSTGLKVILEQ